MSDVLTSKECCKHEEQALAWETVFGQLRKGNEKFYLGDGTGEQLAVREIERLQQRVDAARKILEPLHECDPDIREWLGMPRWDEGVIEIRAAEPPVASRQPIPVTEIITALERESANTDTDCRWLAAVALRQMDGFEARTLMCCIDQRPSEICTTLTKTVSQQLDEAGFKRRPLESLDSDSDETSVCGGCGIPLPLKPGTAHWSGCKHSESESDG